MSEEALRLINEVEEALTQRVSRSAKLLYLLSGMLVAGAVWATTQQLTVASLSSDNSAHKAALKELDAWRIKTDANSYTLREHAENEKIRAEHDLQQNALLNERNLLQEKRLQRLEDNQERLIAITEKLEQKLNVN